jgi:hypothetical protein
LLDHGESGTKSQRPGLDALFAAARRREIRNVVAGKVYTDFNKEHGTDHKFQLK